MLRNEDVAGTAADALHDLLDRVEVSWDADNEVHELTIEGKLLEMLAKTRPACEAGLAANVRSLKLVAGVGFEPTTFRL